MFRCRWATLDPLYLRYHDGEWGFPVSDDVRVFEKVSLEGFQSGLSWLTILRKRENFRRAFAGFDPEQVARFDQADVERLLADPGIVRNRRKIEATIGNARQAHYLVEECGSLAAFLWRYEPQPSARPVEVTWDSLRAHTPESVALSKELKRRGWAFVGPTTCHAAMQALGLVNDHLHGCTIRDSVEEARRGFERPQG